GVDPARDERPQLPRDLAPRHRGLAHVQQPGSQHAGFSAPRRASIVADAMNLDAPGSQESTIAALVGATVTSIDLKPTSLSMRRTSSMCAAPAMHPASAAACSCSAGGIGAMATT